MRKQENYSCGYTEVNNSINKIRYGLLNNYSYNIDSCKKEEVREDKIFHSKCTLRKDKKK